ncbi:hypothetical protein D3C80_1323420 [compost metagenome]
MGGAALVFVAGVDEAASLEHRHGQGAGGVGVLLHEGSGAGEHLFRVVGPDHLAGGQGETLLLVHRQCAPGATGTETVDVPRLEVLDHLRGRQHHSVHIFQRVDTLGR